MIKQYQKYKSWIILRHRILMNFRRVSSSTTFCPPPCTYIILYSFSRITFIFPDCHIIWFTDIMLYYYFNSLRNLRHFYFDFQCKCLHFSQSKDSVCTNFYVIQTHMKEEAKNRYPRKKQPTETAHPASSRNQQPHLPNYLPVHLNIQSNTHKVIEFPSLLSGVTKLISRNPQ